ncbi:ABC transporter permease [Bacteroidia bacterium]|nr:ABC transporter permease [Bacteroidia bacterium]
MIKHYLTIVFRNLWKYKSQSVISIIGLAMGFTFFALASLWIRYEKTYDAFHKGADRICLVRIIRPNATLSSVTPYPLSSYLKETFPEIEDACNPLLWKSNLTVDKVRHEICEAGADSAFLRFFDVKVIAGNLDFLILGSNNIALSAEFAKSLFGDENPLGKIVYESGDERIICAIVDGWSKHSNIPFQILIPNEVYTGWSMKTFIKVGDGTDIKAFEKKLRAHIPKDDDSHIFEQINLTPLTHLRYENPLDESGLKFGQIYLFALFGGLVILCSLFNYLTLFVSRFKIRKKELALRTVCGASGKSLFALFSVEFLLLLFGALIASLFFIRLALHPFQELSNVYLGLSEIYPETSLYIGVIILLTFAVFVLVLALFRKQSLNKSIQKGNKNSFRYVLVTLQLIISVGFIFCTTVMIKQIHFLHHIDLGFGYKNRASIAAYVSKDQDKKEVLVSQFKQIPEITEVLYNYWPLMPKASTSTSSLDEWEDMLAKLPDEKTKFELLPVTEEFLNFYEFQLAEGDFLKEADANEYVLINETTAKVLGWKEPLGKSLTCNKQNYLVKGVLKDFYFASPTTPSQPMIFYYFKRNFGYVLFKYQEGTWKTCLEKIEQLYPNEGFTFYNEEEVYDEFIQSENTLLKILSFVSIVCIIISVFGFFSLISLSCEEKRKEIAIRKINGATMWNILAMYFKTYFSLLVIGSLIAFPIGYYIMRQWIEKYVKQTEISAWIYLAIIFVMAFIIVLCVGWRVWKASVENPAEVIKTE